MNKKGFTLIELLAVIVILAIIALIVTPVVSNIVANARIAANARSVEGHIRNIEIAIISEAFSGTTTGDLDKYDNITSGTTIESSLTIPDNDNVTCSSYSIEHGKVQTAGGCKEKEDKWDKTYTYSISEGAVVTNLEENNNQNANTPSQKTWNKFHHHDEDYNDEISYEFDDSWITWMQENTDTNDIEVCRKIDDATLCVEPGHYSDINCEGSSCLVSGYLANIKTEWESHDSECYIDESGLFCSINYSNVLMYNTSEEYVEIDDDGGTYCAFYSANSYYCSH